ncbi:MAG: glutathione S-transferase family protein [Methylococcales bacterium]
MITLYQFPQHFDLPNLSPFCVKVECFLRMTKLEYTIAPVSDTRKAPKGKCPYIDDDGELIADSEMVMDYLENKYQVNLDSALDSKQKALSRAIQAMLDERFYWTAVYSRWHDDRTWPQISKLFFGEMPFPMNKIIPLVARKQIKGQMYGHGMGRHSEDEIYAIGQADIVAIANLLGEQQFIHGDQATRIDACVFSYIVNFIVPPFESPLRDELLKHSNLVDYNQRMMTAYFPELAGSDKH